MKEIFIVHKDWKGICIINSEHIYRKDYNEEIGTYIKTKNKLTIFWKKWDTEDFFYFDNPDYYYYDLIFTNKFDTYHILEKDQIFKIIDSKEFQSTILLKEKKDAYEISTIKLDEYIKRYKNIDENIYSLEEDLENNNIFVLDIINNSLENKYLFNKFNNTFYNIKNIDDFGKYSIYDNTISMNWNNGYSKKYFTTKYFSKIKSNLKVILPKKILINNRILFSNISLCKNKIILTSSFYKVNNWDLNNLKINIKKNKIINKYVYQNDHYEASSVIILELESVVNNLTLDLTYENNNFKIFLEQLNIDKSNLSAMTLFKNDYNLLKKYLKYYSSLGIEIFFLYYNNKLDNNIIEMIMKLNEYNVKIYLIEWNYPYWIYYTDLKHHHAQTMAINDSLNILKNYSKYILYNDLDEYIVFDQYKNFNEMIIDNDDIDIFIFKNRFCRMGDDLILYEDFDKVFDISKIKKGNYWESGREKNIIKLKNVNVMGVHYVFKKFNDDKINEKVISEFYHIINFKEKYREELMTEYIH